MKGRESGMPEADYWNTFFDAPDVLKPGGTAAVIHWRRDVDTPRGPSMHIRPSPEQCADWGRIAGFRQAERVDPGDSAPWHFGLLLR